MLPSLCMTCAVILSEAKDPSIAGGFLTRFAFRDPSPTAQDDRVERAQDDRGNDAKEEQKKERSAKRRKRNKRGAKEKENK